MLIPAVVYLHNELYLCGEAATSFQHQSGPFCLVLFGLGMKKVIVVTSQKRTVPVIDCVRHSRDLALLAIYSQGKRDHYIAGSYCKRDVKRPRAQF
jgi:hypothetical protein